MAADFVLMPFSLARTLMCRALKSPSRTLRSQLLEYLRNYVIPLLEVDPLSSSERTRYQPLTVLEGGTPTLKLTPAARDAVRAFVSATKRVERIEAIHGFDNADVNTSLDRAHNLAACREQERQKMLNIIKEHETGAQPRPCPYTMDDVAALEADMDHFRASMKAWIDEHAKIREEMQRELEEAWQHPIRLVKLLEQPLRDAGLLQDEKAWWLAERPTLGALIRHIYKRSNFEDFPDAKAAFERQTQADAGGDAGDVEADPAAEELESAYKDFDVCHWNRIVARQDFDDCRMLFRNRDKEYRAELREKYRAVPDM